MYQPWIFAATVAAGSGFFAYAAVQKGVPPPSIEPAPESVQLVPRPLAVSEPIVEPVPSVLEIEPIVIEGKRRVTRAAPPEPVAEATRPCSNWREIGPSHVSQGKPTGAVSVRELCR